MSRNNGQEEEFYVGRPRPKNNPLIHRSEVGKPSFHNDMPSLPEDYTFGAQMKKDAEGAGEVMLTWQCHAPPPSKMQYDFGRDFLTLNKRSVERGASNSKDVSDFRKETDARLKPKVTGKKPAVVPDHVTNDKTHSYGSKSGESESVADLIQNRWEGEWVSEQRTLQEVRDRKRTKENMRRCSPARMTYKRKTPSPAMLQEAAPSIKDTFTLKQFKGVQSRYRTPTPTLPDI